MPQAEWIEATRSPHFWMGFFPAVLVTVTSFIALFRALSHLRIITDTPTSLIRSASQGYAELHGITRMMDGEPIIAPLSGLRCVWYRFTVEEKTEGKGEWRLVENGTSTAIFHLDDGTGRCIVDPDGADVTPSITQHWRGNSRRPGGLSHERGFWDEFARSGRYRYEESRIDEGSPLFAIGYLQGLASGDPGTVNDRVRQLVRRWKQDQAALKKRFDEDRDGLISSQEWEVALQLAEREVLTNWEEPAREAELNLIRKPPDGRPFVLSTIPEQKLIQGYRQRAWLSGAFFLLFGTAAVWALYLRYIANG